MSISLRWFLLTSLVGRLPVRVRKGIAHGARWSLFPWTSYWRGTHESEAQARLIALGDWTGKHVWDLGSHYGIFAVGLGLRVGPTGSVAAFEPNPISYARLQLHVRRNHLHWVKTFPCAASDIAANRLLFLYEGPDSTSSHLAYDGENWDETAPAMRVNSLRLDDLVAAGEIHLPDFIKIDIEGHAHRALAGAADSLKKSRPILLIGLHGDAEVSGVLSILEPLGYRVTPIQQNSPAMPSSDYDYLFEPIA